MQDTPNINKLNENANEIDIARLFRHIFMQSKLIFLLFFIGSTLSIYLYITAPKYIKSQVYYKFHHLRITPSAFLKRSLLITCWEVVIT